jgi:hypothetical protein
VLAPNPSEAGVDGEIIQMDALTTELST